MNMFLIHRACFLNPIPLLFFVDPDCIDINASLGELTTSSSFMSLNCSISDGISLDVLALVQSNPDLSCMSCFLVFCHFVVSWVRCGI